MSTPAWENVFDEALRTQAATRRHLVGVSGGCDSVSLLRLLHARGWERLIVCHLHHGLRGRPADADAHFVERLAQQLGYEAVIARVEVRQVAAENGLGLEAAGRLARREFFVRLARRRRVKTLFLGHHADDQAETFLYRLLRGAGPRGLGAMSRESSLGPLIIVRPLLHAWRSEVEAHARTAGWKWRVDASNSDPRFARNRLRHEVIPALTQAWGKEVRPMLWRAAEIFRAENEWIEALAGSLLDAPPEHLSVASLRSMPLALQRRLLQAWLGRFVAGIDFSQVESARALLDPDPEGHPAKANLPEGAHVRRSAGRLWVQLAPP